MIVMNIEMDNFMSFNNFAMNLSYPKKIVNSSIENEFLTGFTNFRYKKVNILMGANATGKTSFGKMLMNIFHFMDKKQYTRIAGLISDKTKEAAFCIDFVANMKYLFRVNTVISPPEEGQKLTGENIDVSVRSVEIQKKDSYESCLKRLLETKQKKYDNYIEELEKVTGLSWTFAYPEDDSAVELFSAPKDSGTFIRILDFILRALDPSIVAVDRLSEVEGAYAIRTKNNVAIIQDGQIEKALLSVMIELLGADTQLFFTTHNTDILDMQLPKHSYTFMKKEVYGEDSKIECINAGEILKRSTDSLKSAVENDLFSSAPAMDLIYDILDI